MWLKNCGHKRQFLDNSRCRKLKVERKHWLILSRERLLSNHSLATLTRHYRVLKLSTCWSSMNDAVVKVYKLFGRCFFYPVQNKKQPTYAANIITVPLTTLLLTAVTECYFSSKAPEYILNWAGVCFTVYKFNFQKQEHGIILSKVPYSHSKSLRLSLTLRLHTHLINMEVGYLQELVPIFRHFWNLYVQL